MSNFKVGDKVYGERRFDNGNILDSGTGVVVQIFDNGRIHIKYDHDNSNIFYRPTLFNDIIIPIEVYNSSLYKLMREVNE